MMVSMEEVMKDLEEVDTYQEESKLLITVVIVLVFVLNQKKKMVRLYNLHLI